MVPTKRTTSSRSKNGKNGRKSGKNSAIKMVAERMSLIVGDVLDFLSDLTGTEDIEKAMVMGVLFCATDRGITRRCGQLLYQVAEDDWHFTDKGIEPEQYQRQQQQQQRQRRASDWRAPLRQTRSRTRESERDGEGGRARVPARGLDNPSRASGSSASSASGGSSASEDPPPQARPRREISVRRSLWARTQDHEAPKDKHYSKHRVAPYPAVAPDLRVDLSGARAAVSLHTEIGASELQRNNGDEARASPRPSTSRGDAIAAQPDGGPDSLEARREAEREGQYPELKTLRRSTRIAQQTPCVAERTRKVRGKKRNAK